MVRHMNIPLKRVSYWRYQLVKRPKALRIMYNLLRKADKHSTDVELFSIAWNLTRYVPPPVESQD
jgi:hypothetical protein